jgi:succinate-acetate transporter protein
MKTLFALAVGTAAQLTAGIATAQNGNMMNGGTWGGGWMGSYGGPWVPIVVVALVVGLVVWGVMRK